MRRKRIGRMENRIVIVGECRHYEKSAENQKKTKFCDHNGEQYLALNHTASKLASPNSPLTGITDPGYTRVLE